jgi:CRP-like cAMP-binding protein
MRRDRCARFRSGDDRRRCVVSLFCRAAYVRDVTLFLAKTGDLLAPGAVFGERFAESGEQAIADAALLLEPREADPTLYVRLAANVGRRIARLQTKLEALSRAGVEARIARAPLEIADDFGVPVAAGTKLELPLSQEERAHLAGTSRESCSQAVAAFARAGFVIVGRLRGLVIADWPRSRHAALSARFHACRYLVGRGIRFAADECERKGPP